MPSLYPPSNPLTNNLSLAKPYSRLVTSAAGPLIAGLASGILLTLLPTAEASAAPGTLVAQTYPLLSSGSTGSAVSQLQATLKLLGFYSGEINGTYTAATQNAVAQFQAVAGISADGIAGPSTWTKLLPAPGDVASIPASQEPAPPAIAQTPEPAIPAGPPILRPGIEGPAVSQLQKELTTLGYYQGAIDGGYGEFTQDAVKAFQADRGLAVDAIVGPSTWDALTEALSE